MVLSGHEPSEIPANDPCTQIHKQLESRFHGDPHIVGFNLSLVLGLASRNSATDIITQQDTAEPLLNQPLQLAGIGILEGLKGTDGDKSCPFSWIKQSVLIERSWRANHTFEKLADIIEAKKRIFEQGERLGHHALRNILAFDRSIKGYVFLAFRREAEEWYTQSLHVDLGVIHKEIATRYTDIGDRPLMTGQRGVASSAINTMKDYELLAAEQAREKGPARTAGGTSFTHWLQAEYEWLARNDEASNSIMNTMANAQEATAQQLEIPR